VTGVTGPGEGGGGDRIQLRGLRAVGTHGVLPEEKSRAQPFEIDLDLAVDLGLAGRSDLLSDTVDYAGIAETVVGIVSGASSFQLLEALAGAVADATLACDDRIAAVTVHLRKLQPPLAMDIATVGVRITRPQ
jgi:dihydroneopterin aldolase